MLLLETTNTLRAIPCFSKEHVTELHHMETSVKLRFLEEMSLVKKLLPNV